MNKRILIVEDEKNIVDILSFNLSKEGYETLEAYDGEAGLQLALEQNPDLILLDLMLPKMNGFDVCRSLRRENRSTCQSIHLIFKWFPIVFLLFDAYVSSWCQDVVLFCNFCGICYCTKSFYIF